jgi:hypothetical protein
MAKLLLTLIGLMMITPAMARVPAEVKSSAGAIKNSWRGVTPLRSSVEDVARALGEGAEVTEGNVSGPYKVEGGEVTISFLTESIAKVYRAPRSMVGKVLTVYFRPDAPVTRAELSLSRAFRTCKESLARSSYYLVSDAGLAYELRTSDNRVETIIYQPTRAEIQRLWVNSECVF